MLNYLVINSFDSIYVNLLYCWVFSMDESSKTFQDLVVGYMGVPKYSGLSMTEHPQYITVR